MVCLLASRAQSIIILWALWIHSKMKVIQWIKLGLNKMQHKTAHTMANTFWMKLWFCIMHSIMLVLSDIVFYFVGVIMRWSAQPSYWWWASSSTVMNEVTSVCSSFSFFMVHFVCCYILHLWSVLCTDMLASKHTQTGCALFQWSK